MAGQDQNRTEQTTDKTASAARRAADQTATPGIEAAQQGGKKLQEQTNAMLGKAGRVSQEAARRTSENMELMKRLAETMLSGAKETSSEMVGWTREAAERQAAATREITQARSLDEVLEIQNRHIQENLRALLDLSAKISQVSAATASEASSQVAPNRRS
jgi:hypothetical protein